jgi:hypothetical protein
MNRMIRLTPVSTGNSIAAYDSMADGIGNGINRKEVII